MEIVSQNQGKKCDKETVAKIKMKLFFWWNTL